MKDNLEEGFPVTFQEYACLISRIMGIKDFMLYSQNSGGFYRKMNRGEFKQWVKTELEKI